MKNLFKMLAAILAVFVLCLVPIETVKVSATDGAKVVTKAFDVNDDGIVNIYDFVLMKRDIIQNENNWTVLDAVILQKFLLTGGNDNSETPEVPEVLKMSELTADQVTLQLLSSLSRNGFRRKIITDGNSDDMNGNFELLLDDNLILAFDADKDYIVQSEPDLLANKLVANFIFPDTLDGPYDLAVTICMRENGEFISYIHEISLLMK